ncbi:C40 family peptidase [Plantactinospora soyae]|uniref:Cell wall-associated NlpC family hydrolase n=1 Tax=Plantactinospora soyae TaxID=1544732 RepID=A0A927LZK4_9ACTN|nr:C40 family peptidase [Plantactinospora soyae]MBE1485289.1 cell wall-associated NlpC family hydrolase [Plantactinospora soyae]
MPTTAWPRRATALAAGMTVALALTPTPGRGAPVADPIEQQLSVMAEQLEIVIEQYNDLREELRETRASSAAIHAEMGPLERSIEAHRTEVSLLAAHAYRTGDARSLGVVGTLLSAATPDNLVDPLILLDRLSRTQHRVITRLTESHARLAAARRTAEALAARQRGQERQLAARKLAIETDLARLSHLPDPSAGMPVEAAPRLPDPVPGAAGKAVRFAYAQLGKGYRWGGSGPDGYDCSGLTSAAWAAAGVRLPHNAARQWRVVTQVSRAARQAGDLVFYYRDLHHVAIYIGGGKIIHAPRTGTRIRIDRVDYQPIRGYGRPG